MTKRIRFIFTCSLLSSLIIPCERLTAYESIEKYNDWVANEPLTSLYDVNDYVRQLYSRVGPFYTGFTEDGVEKNYKVQRSYGGYLYLGANEVFFSKIGTFKLDGKGKSTKHSIEYLNNGTEWRYIRGFRDEQESVSWGFITTNQGDVYADFFISLNHGLRDLGTGLSIQIDDLEPVDVELTEEIIANGTFRIEFPDLVDGVHTFKVTLTKVTEKHGLRIHNVKLSGDGIVNSYVMRTRWRPKAAYTNFQSSANPDDVKATIFELYSDSALGHFSPLQGDFGYYGPIFQPGGSANHMAMSFWSSGKDEDLLPLNERSHLLGIGSTQGRFGQWAHEGTGAKVREWPIFVDTNTSKKYVVGLRFSDDGRFRTFYGYFWNEKTEKWHLYTIGRKIITEPLTSMKTSAFIEVAAGSGKERSGHVIRTVNYRGWVRNSNGVWSDIDQYKSDNLYEKRTETHAVSEDGKYFTANTGGFMYYDRRYGLLGPWISKPKETDLPLYMTPKKLKGLNKIPFKPVIKSATKDEYNVLTLSFQTRARKEATARICWGKDDALTNSQWWDHCKEINLPDNTRKKIHIVKLDASAEDRYVRILVRNDIAQMWNFETYKILSSEAEAEEGGSIAILGDNDSTHAENTSG